MGGRKVSEAPVKQPWGTSIVLSSPVVWRHAAIYATLVVVAALVTWLVVAVAGNDLYHRKTGMVTWVPMAYFIVLALVTYRRRLDVAMPFGRGLTLGALTTLFSAVGCAVVLSLFGVVAGQGVLEAHIQQMLHLLEASKAQLLALPQGAVYYPQVVAKTKQMTVADVVLDDFQLRLVVGLIVSLLTAILFRKANPDGSEPERPVRPTE